MKYLGIHKLIWFILVLIYTLIHAIIIGVAYIVYILWNFRLPKGNFWYNANNVRSKWNGEYIKDYNIWQSIMRRYNIINN